MLSVSVLIVVSGLGNLVMSETRATPIRLLPTSKASRFLLLRIITASLLLLDVYSYFRSIAWSFGQPERTIVNSYILDTRQITNHLLNITALFANYLLFERVNIN